jgi:hypothetical protein
MKLTATFLAAVLLASPALAGDVYVTTDAKGNKVYTDTPQTVPAQRMNVHSASTDPAATDASYDAEMQRYAAQDKASAKAQAEKTEAKQAAQATAADQAKRCQEARQRYETLMTNWRIYEPGPNDERTYLTSEQIDAARVNAKQVMDQFCAGQ